MKKLICVAMLLSAGCNARTSTTPTAIETVSTGSLVSVSSTSVQAQPVTSFICPTTPPFVATVPIVVTAADVNMFLTGVSFQFTDQNGVRMPPVTLPAPIPTAQFGSALVQARSSRTFPVDVPFGCGTGRVGVLALTVRTADATGLARVQGVNVNVF
jgi:hypothetical protein